MRTKNPDKFYFTQETEDAIVAYNLETDMEKRNEIFNKHIHTPFKKLAECVCNTFKFNCFDDGLEAAMSDCVSHMTEQMHYFNPERKSKAYSFFGTVAKHWFLRVSQENKKKWDKQLCISGTTEKEQDFADFILLNESVDMSRDRELNNKITDVQMQKFQLAYNWYVNEYKFSRPKTVRVLKEIKDLLEGKKEWVQKPNTKKLSHWLTVAAGLNLTTGGAVQSTATRVMRMWENTQKNSLLCQMYKVNIPLAEITDIEDKRHYNRHYRMCPKCMKTMTYRGPNAEANALRAENNCTLCRSCSNKVATKYAPDAPTSRICPICEKTIQYLGANAKYNATYNSNRSCKVCAQKMRNNRFLVKSC